MSGDMHDAASRFPGFPATFFDIGIAHEALLHLPSFWFVGTVCDFVFLSVGTSFAVGLIRCIYVCGYCVRIMWVFEVCMHEQV